MTETQTSTRRGARTPAKPEPRTLEIEVGRGGQALINKLANTRLGRLLAEREEKPLKEKVRALWIEAADEMNDDDVLVVKAMGVVRGRVTIRSRAKSVDLDLLQQGWPEAFEACVTDTKSPQFDPC